MVSVLAGSAQNTGLKNFVRNRRRNQRTLATAWTNMLQRNTSITILDLRKANCEEMQMQILKCVQPLLKAC
jgi:hypothetical protein